MFALGLLRRLRWSSKIETLAQRVARKSQLIVWNRVALQVHEMGPSEVRGYVRARSSIVIASHVDLVMAEHPWSPAWLRVVVAERACEVVLQRVLSEAQRTGRARRVSRAA